MVKKLSCISCGSLKRFPHTFTKANLSETSPFLSAQMALLSTFFQVYIVLGMYNFG